MQRFLVGLVLVCTGASGWLALAGCDPPGCYDCADDCDNKWESCDDQCESDYGMLGGDEYGACADECERNHNKCQHKCEDKFSDCA